MVGLGEAFNLYNDGKTHELEINKTKEIRDNFWSELRQLIPKVELNGPNFIDRHAGNLNVFFPGVEAADLIMALQPNICASSGAACSSSSIEPSYVLNSIHDDKFKAKFSLRLSFCSTQESEEIKKATRFIAKKYFELLTISD